MYREEPYTTKQRKDDDAYYTIRWSPLAKVDKFEIIKKVPSVAGIYQLYFLDDHKSLTLFFMVRVWYGGLRVSLREHTDPLLVEDPKRRKILETRTCYYRYTILSSVKDMEDIFHILSLDRLPPSRVPEPSGRYREIYVQEKSEDKLVDRK